MTKSTSSGYSSAKLTKRLLSEIQKWIGRIRQSMQIRNGFVSLGCNLRYSQKKVGNYCGEPLARTFD